MHAKNQISLTRKTLYVIMLIAVILSALGAGGLPTVRAQAGSPEPPTPEVTPTPTDVPEPIIEEIQPENPLGILDEGMTNTPTSIKIKFGSYAADQGLQDAIYGLLISRPAGLFDGTKFGITSERIDNDWTLLSIASLDDLLFDDYLVGIGKSSSLIIGHKELNQNWRVALSGTIEFSGLIKNAPIAFISETAKELIDPLSNDVNSAWVISYKFPWAPGSWEYRQGWHQGTSLDLGTRGADKRILAAADGLITGICKGRLSANVSVRHWDGNTLQYFHIDVNKLGQGIEVGKEVLRGQILGTLRPGTWSWTDDIPTDGTACGYTELQAADSAHIHWVIPSSLTVDGWSITQPDNVWRKDTQTRIVGGTLASTNYILVKQYEFKSTWLNAPGGWPHLFVIDSRIRQFTVDGSTPYTFDGGCNAVWINLYPGDHTLVELYELRGSDVPTIDVKSRPVLVPPVCAGEPTEPEPESDTTPPTGSWISPSNGQTISSRSVTLNVNASDNSGGSGVKQVDFSAKWGGGWRWLGSDSSAPYSISWDMCSAGVPNGDIELGLEVWDNANNKFVYSTYNANYHINKSYTCTQGTDTTPPTAYWTSPGNGQSISSSSLTLSVNASDNSGGSGVPKCAGAQSGTTSGPALVLTTPPPIPSIGICALQACQTAMSN